VATSSERVELPVAPDAVRVWRGYRNPSVSQETFFEKLGSVFIPGTVQIQAPVGLTAYLPSVLPAEKPAGIPDEIALVFYEYQDAYDEAKETVGGRAYSDMHALVFDLTRSHSGFPVRCQGELEPDMRYHLFDSHVDWQFGSVNTFVGTSAGRDPNVFLKLVRDFLVAVQSQGDEGPDGAVAVAATDHVVYWEHWAGQDQRSLIAQLVEQVEPVYHQAIQPQPLFETLWQPYAGVTVTGGESFNSQFYRRRETH
jgi:hypothetical protein